MIHSVGASVTKVPQFYLWNIEALMLCVTEKDSLIFSEVEDDAYYRY